MCFSLFQVLKSVCNWYELIQIEMSCNLLDYSAKLISRRDSTQAFEHNKKQLFIY